MNRSFKHLTAALSSLAVFAVALSCSSLSSRAPAVATTVAPEPARVIRPGQERQVLTDDGIRFTCEPARLPGVEKKMDAYLSLLGIEPKLIVKKKDLKQGTLLYTLNSPKTDTNTLNFKDRPELAIHDEIVFLPGSKYRYVYAVSKKEIALALLQHGRLTELKGRNCDAEVLADHIAVRQNVVAWAETLNWVFPEGDPAEWNQQYWQNGTPSRNFPLHESVNDVFVNQQPYSFGCYTASKLVFMQGILDFYRRIKPNPALILALEKRIWSNQEPIIDVDPDYEATEFRKPGKLLTIQFAVAPMNFVPGDWSYLLNTDPVTHQKSGYEGSNAVYLGRNRFDDYYNDNNHYYTFEQKLDEVWQWRHGVFSRSRDAAKIRPLSKQDLERLATPPSEGGLVRAYRIFPYFLGGEELPKFPEEASR